MREERAVGQDAWNGSFYGHFFKAHGTLSAVHWYVGVQVTNALCSGRLGEEWGFTGPLVRDASSVCSCDEEKS